VHGCLSMNSLRSAGSRCICSGMGSVRLAQDVQFISIERRSGLGPEVRVHTLCV